MPPTDALSRNNDIEKYKRFMKINTFPEFEEESYIVDINANYSYGGRAEYTSSTKKHKLMLPSNIPTSEYRLFHELTHIYDMEQNANGDKIHDYCLAGYLEYHASQVELLVVLGAKTIDSRISFSMMDRIDGMEWSVKQYLDSKLNTAKALICDSDMEKRVAGLEVFYNFLGFKSICCLYATDYSEEYDYRDIVSQMSLITFSRIRQHMTGMLDDIDTAVHLYACAVAEVKKI